MTTKPLHRAALFCTCLALFIVAPTPCDAQESAFMRDEDGFVERIDQIYEVERDGSLTLEAEVGSVRVDSWANDEVEIRIEKRVKGRREDRARNAFNEIEVVLSQQNNEVRIQVVDNGSDYFLRNRVTVAMMLRVPESCALDLSTVDGKIEIDNMKGPVTARAVDGDIEINATHGHVTASTTDGDIEIRKTRGTVTANTVDGDIDIRHVTEEVSATSTDGDIEIRHAKSAVNANTVDGNIETNTTDGEVDAGALEGNIHLFDARGSVNAQAARGSIEVYVARTNLDPPDAEPDLDARCILKTNEGDVTIHLPDDLPATIEAEGSSGGLVLSRLWREDIGHIYTDFGMNKSEWGVFFYVQSEASGNINGGGGRIRLKTNSGNIFIRER